MVGAEWRARHSAIATSQWFVGRVERKRKPPSFPGITAGCAPLTRPTRYSNEEGSTSRGRRRQVYDPVIDIG